jgi:hypothetical protein
MCISRTEYSLIYKKLAMARLSFALFLKQVPGNRRNFPHDLQSEEIYVILYRRGI